MKKYIDAEAAKLKVAIETAEAGAGHATDAGFISFLRGFRTLFDENIDEMPAADVKEVRHGKWVIEEAGDGWKRAICPHCLKVFLYAKGHYQIGNAPFCPNCGAKMDGGKDDER